MAPSADATDGQDGLRAGDRPAWLAPGMRGAGKMLGEHRRRPGQVWGTGVEGCESGVGARGGCPCTRRERRRWGGSPVASDSGNAAPGCRGAVFIPGLCPGSLLPEEPPALSPAPPGPEATWLCLWARLVFRGALGSRSNRAVAQPCARGNLKPRGQARCPAVPRSPGTSAPPLTARPLPPPPGVAAATEILALYSALGSPHGSWTS
ncbi:uncharacterized protein LOC128116534 [Peromyscus californicus insignis]|uniref:uncharacterized protein LOC128116534 n=1 Tax=Peromyscus californicus insignis TaxID=564181 RepID=UPI0022A6F392|nr:uncharacterized protein LOC128116534 [Peromyscus californicus insignis]